MDLFDDYLKIASWYPWIPPGLQVILLWYPKISSTVQGLKATKQGRNHTGRYSQMDFCLARYTSWYMRWPYISPLWLENRHKEWGYCSPMAGSSLPGCSAMSGISTGNWYGILGVKQLHVLLVELTQVSRRFTWRLLLNFPRYPEGWKSRTTKVSLPAQWSLLAQRTQTLIMRLWVRLWGFIGVVEWIKMANNMFPASQPNKKVRKNRVEQLFIPPSSEALFYMLFLSYRQKSII